MYTRTFEREGNDYEVINLSEYGFEWFINGKSVRTGLIEDLEETVELLLDEGFEEII